ncbi:hypothetical protein [Bacteroides sp.]|uniref:hypothetical protein n=1 Tax=Bacteroides sp. TaxID=29523 RepID=UPI0025840784|nr:hypothetical protein [Bacteroides sp.]
MKKYRTTFHSMPLKVFLCLLSLTFMASLCHDFNDGQTVDEYIRETYTLQEDYFLMNNHYPEYQSLGTIFQPQPWRMVNTDEVDLLYGFYQGKLWLKIYEKESNLLLADFTTQEKVYQVAKSDSDSDSDLPHIINRIDLDNVYWNDEWLVFTLKNEYPSAKSHKVTDTQIKLYQVSLENGSYYTKVLTESQPTETSASYIEGLTIWDNGVLVQLSNARMDEECPMHRLLYINSQGEIEMNEPISLIRSMNSHRYILPISREEMLVWEMAYFPYNKEYNPLCNYRYSKLYRFHLKQKELVWIVDNSSYSNTYFYYGIRAYHGYIQGNQGIYQYQLINPYSDTQGSRRLIVDLETGESYLKSNSQ